MKAPKACVWIVLLSAVVLLHSVIHVFISARVEARRAREVVAARRLGTAIGKFIASHEGFLPGKDWPDQIRRIDPTLSSTIARQEGENWTGFAAVPGVLGRKVDDLNPRAVLFVEYASPARTNVLRSASDIGDLTYHNEKALVIAAELRVVLWPTDSIRSALKQQGCWRF